MKRDALKRFFSIRLLLLSLIISISYLYGQMPPHPKLLEDIKHGTRTAPYVLKNLEQLKQKGIDAPWTSEEQKSLKKNSIPGQRNFGLAQPPVGGWKALAILVQFSDKPKQVNGTFFDSLLFLKKEGTLKDYYKKVTYGSLDIITVNMPGDIGWQVAPQSYAYYCNNQSGTGNYPNNSQKLAEDIVKLVDPAVDFSQYDNDYDGIVDGLFIIHAGSGAERTGNNIDIWSVKWETAAKLFCDGVRVSQFTIEPEYWLAPGDLTIGVFAHELGHCAFRLPDLYDLDNSSQGLGRWSLMSRGCWNGNDGDSPAYPDAYCRVMMGYVNPVIVKSNTALQSIPDAEETNTVFKLWRNGTPGSQYFLVENRQNVYYDKALPGNGLLIYHVDDSVLSENINEWYPGKTNSGHYLVALEQADGLYDLERDNNQGDAGDPFPGSTSSTDFYNSSAANSKDYNFIATGVGVRNISLSGSPMTASFEVTSADTTLRLVSPNGGEKWPSGYTKQIVIDAINTGPVKVEYSTDDGINWNSIGFVDFISGGIIDWTVPNTPSAQCRLRAVCLLKPSLSDQSDNVFTIVPVPEGQFSVQFDYNANDVTGAPGNAGAVFIPSLNEFWTTRSASNLFHRWTKNGKLISEFTIPHISEVRGLTFDGHMVYASNATKTIYIIDPDSRELAGTITTPDAAGFVTFDPSANSGQGGFWIGDLTTDLTLISRNGKVLRTIPYSSLGSKLNYGAAYDNLTPGGPYIWLSSQSRGQKLIQISVSDGKPTGIEHSLLSDIGSEVSGSSNGGIFVSLGIISGKAILGGMLQGRVNHLFGYQLTDLAPNITLLSPNGGEMLRSGRNLTIKWTSGLLANVRVDLTADNGASWKVINALIPSKSGSLKWIVPDVVSSQCKIRITDLSNPSLYDESDNLFTITQSSVANETEPNNTIETGNYIDFGDIMNSSISPAGDIDYYKFTADPGDTITVYSVNRNSSALNGRIMIQDLNGITLADNDDFITQNQSRVVWTAGSSGTYVIRYSYNENSLSSPSSVFSTSGNTGDYTITLNRFTTSAPQHDYLSTGLRTFNTIEFDMGFYPNGLYTAAKLEYGTTQSLGNSVDIAPGAVNSTGKYELKYFLQNLQPNTQYYSRVILTNSKGTAISENYIFSTLDKPEGWVLQAYAFPYYLYSVSFCDFMNGLACGTGGDIFKTTDGGKSWIIKQTGDKYNLPCVCFLDHNTAFSIDAAGYLLKSSDGGISWCKISSGTWVTKIAISFFDQMNGITTSNGIYLTTDGGDKWTLTNNKNDLITICIADSNTAFAAGGYGAMLRTLDKGMHWSPLKTGTTNTLNGISFADKHNGIAVGDNVILRTTDGGNTWIKQSCSTILRSIAFSDANTAVAVGDGGCAIKTTDKGLNWRPINMGTNSTLYSICSSGGAFTAVGKYGIILRSSDSTQEIIEEKKIPLAFQLYQNYPNPFNPSTKINYALPKDSYIKITIYNALGEEVRTLADEIQKAGINEIIFNAANLSSGVYFCRLEARPVDGQSIYREVKKLLLIK